MCDDIKFRFMQTLVVYLKSIRVRCLDNECLRCRNTGIGRELTCRQMTWRIISRSLNTGRPILEGVVGRIVGTSVAAERAGRLILTGNGLAQSTGAPGEIGFQIYERATDDADFVATYEAECIALGLRVLKFAGYLGVSKHSDVLLVFDGGAVGGPDAVP